MADNVLYLNISLVSWKCLFEVWLFDKGGMAGTAEQGEKWEG